MFLWDWVTNLLNYFGFNKKSGTLIFVGLDNAGKTTLFNMLKNDHLSVPIPTRCPTSEEFSLGNIRFVAYDLGGHKQVRRVWKEYFQIADAIVFILDASDHIHLNESKAEFNSLLEDEQTASCPILLLGNKIDKQDAIGELDLREIFNLNGLTTGKGIVPRSTLNNQRPIELFMISVKMRTGYGEAFRWLAQYF